MCSKKCVTSLESTRENLNMCHISEALCNTRSTVGQFNILFLPKRLISSVSETETAQCKCLAHLQERLDYAHASEAVCAVLRAMRTMN